MADPNDYTSPQFQPTAYGETPYSPQSTPLIQQLLQKQLEAGLPIVGGFLNRGAHPLQAMQGAVMGGPDAAQRILQQGDTRVTDMPPSSIGDAFQAGSTIMPGFGAALDRPGLGMPGGRPARFTIQQVRDMYKEIKSTREAAEAQQPPQPPQDPSADKPIGFSKRALTDDNMKDAIELQKRGVSYDLIGQLMGVNKYSLFRTIKQGGYNQKTSADYDTPAGGGIRIGRPGGRRFENNSEAFSMVKEMLASGETYDNIANELSKNFGESVSKATVHNHIYTWRKKGMLPAETGINAGISDQLGQPTKQWDPNET